MATAGASSAATSGAATSTETSRMSDLPLIVGGRRGRPPRAGIRAQSRIEFVVTADERRYLEQMAKSQGYTSLAAAVRDACNSFVSDYGGRTIFTPSGKKR